MVGVEEDLTQLGVAFTTNKSEYTTRIHGFGDIIFRSYDRPERIIAYEVAHSIVDEIDTIKKDKAAEVWRKVNERNRQKISGVINTIGCVTTPDQGINGLVYQKWVKEAREGYQLIKAPTHSNPYLPDDYIDQIRANYDPVLASLYINGDFVSLNKNKVYHFYDREKHNTTERLGSHLHIGLDFNIGGCVAIVGCFVGDVLHIVDEFVSHDTYDFINNLTRYDGKKVTIYPDASGKSGRTNATASDITLIENAGYYVDAPRSNPPIRQRVNSVNGGIAHNKILINSDKCPELATALETQGYDKNNDPEKFTEHPSIDDYNDSLGYLVDRVMPVNKPLAEFKNRMIQI
jgi:hypothetical protein